MVWKEVIEDRGGEIENWKVLRNLQKGADEEFQNLKKSHICIPKDFQKPLSHICVGKDSQRPKK